MRKIIFVDTNKIYSSLCRYIQHGELYSTNVFRHPNHNKTFRLYISRYVVAELENTYLEKQQQSLEIKVLMDFLSYTQMSLSDSLEDEKLESKLIGYINDQHDIQILADALYIDADIILTNNLKDFHCEDIERDLALLVTNEIPAELLA